MSPLDRTTKKSASIECLDEINEFLGTLDRYLPTAVAVALGTHLQTALCALVECDLCTADEIRVFLQELERDVYAEICARQGGKLQ